MTQLSLVFVGAAVLWGTASAAGSTRLSPDSFLLGSLPSHAGQVGVVFPAVGLGTGGGGYRGQSYGEWPECWNACDDAECVNPDRPTFKGCPQFVEAAVASFVQLGGRRIDSADTYHSQAPAAFAMLRAGVPRNATFFVAKLGPSLPMGATDSHAQFNRTLLAANLTYVDHLQLHWPSCAMGNGCGPATDPACSNSSGAFDEVKCRMNTYRAMLDILASGRARSIGVSNYNTSHLQEIVAAGLPLPTVNQISVNIWHYQAELSTIAWCNAHGVLVNSWCPLDRPDSRTRAPPLAPNALLDPVALSVAAAHGATPGAVQLAWQLQLGIAVNPRSQNAAHMRDNLAATRITLTADEMAALGSRPQYACAPPDCSTWCAASP